MKDAAGLLLPAGVVVLGFPAFVFIARRFGEESALATSFLVLFALIARSLRRMDAGVTGWDPVANMTLAGFGLLFGALVIMGYAAIFRRWLDPD